MIYVKKYSGELMPFEPEILIQSLSKSGASSKEVDEVFKKVNQKIYNEISTRDLYQIAFDELRNIRKSYAARYSLKKALRDLGPEGFYFETWIAKIFQQDSCQTIQGVTLQGQAVTHEIDVLAVKDNELLLCECKFKNDVTAKTPVTTSMYFLSRFNDLKPFQFNFFDKKLKPTQGWLITNTYFTSDAIDFANFYGIKLLSWNYPENDSIKTNVDSMALYPITCLTTLSSHHKELLLKQKVILVKELVNNSEAFKTLKISGDKKQEIMEEARELIGM